MKNENIYVSKGQVAKRLGISMPTAGRLIEAGELGDYLVTGKTGCKVLVSALERYIERNTVHVDPTECNEVEWKEAA